MNFERLKQLNDLLWFGPESEEAEYWQQYSAVFDGTDADIFVPLWVSACKGEGDVLLNRETLKVVRWYRAFGSDPAKGLPPDDVRPVTAFLLRLVSEGRAGDALRFFEEIAEPLYAEMARSLQAYRGGFYEKLAGMLAHVVRELPSLLKEQACVAAGARAEAQKPSEEFLSAAPHSAEEPLLLGRIVPICGRGNCGGRCQLMARVEDGCVLSIADGDVKPCAKGHAYRQIFLTPRRLRYPMVRTGRRGEGKFRRISWDEALDLMEEKIRALTAKYGPGCRYVNYATGVSSVLRGDRMAKRLLALGGGYLGNHYTYSSAAAAAAIPYSYGTADTGCGYLTYKETQLLVLWGHNPVVTLFNETAREVLIHLKEKGVPIVVIDPRYTETAAFCGAKWIRVRPGTDAALAAAVAYVLWEEGLQDQAFIDRCCQGMDPGTMPKGAEGEESYRDYVFGRFDGVPKTPAWASAITGTSEEDILWLAHALGRVKPAAILPGNGVQRNANGEQIVRSITALACLTGNVGVLGGAAGARGYGGRHERPILSLPKNPYGGSISVFLWSDAILRGHAFTKRGEHIKGRETLDSDIKLLFNLGGNILINQHSDVRRTEEILKDESKCEFIVVSDLFMTPSARYADLLLPGASLFECESMAGPWGDGDYLLYGNQCVEPLFESRFEFDWLKELADRLGIADFSEGCGSVREWNKLLYERTRAKEPDLPPFEEFAEKGIFRHERRNHHVAFALEAADPAAHPFPTPSGRIEIYSPALKALEEEDIPPIPKHQAAFEGVGDPVKERYPIQLIGSHTKRRYHSVGDIAPWMEDLEPHAVWMNPRDAASRGIEDGAVVEVYNDRGRVRIRAKLSDQIMEGVASMPQGAWHKADADGTDVRGNINTLAICRPTPLAKGNPQHSNLVEIRRAEE
ncbi:MAG: molybdopterin-dependent oxidoreductase [Clostridia bacterium]|nr:molybdopterin-dependent oxidoreductase [Clostridia bacterium]